MADASGDWLQWFGVRSRLVGPGPELLARFVGLADADATEVAAFARRWGLLGAHDLGRVPRLLEEPIRDLPEQLALRWELVVKNPPAGREPIAAWRWFSAHAAALFHLIDSLERRAPPRDVDMEVLCRPPAATWPDVGGLQPRWLNPDRPPPSALKDQRELVETLVARWLRFGAVGPELQWTASRRTIRLRARGLAGALAVGLLTAASGNAALTVCHHCARIHPRDKAPRRSQRSFCQSCQTDGVPLKYAKRDWWSRQRSGTVKTRKGG
jgi:hypothetical protein